MPWRLAAAWPDLPTGEGCSQRKMGWPRGYTLQALVYSKRAPGGMCLESVHLEVGIAKSEIFPSFRKVFRMLLYFSETFLTKKKLIKIKKMEKLTKNFRFLDNFLPLSGSVRSGECALVGARLGFTEAAVCRTAVGLSQCGNARRATQIYQRTGRGRAVGGG